MAIELTDRAALEIRVDGGLWGYALKVNTWWVAYYWDSETGNLEQIGAPDTLDDLRALVEAKVEEYAL